MIVICILNMSLKDNSGREECETFWKYFQQQNKLPVVMRLSFACFHMHTVWVVFFNHIWDIMCYFSPCLTVSRFLVEASSSIQLFSLISRHFSHFLSFLYRLIHSACLAYDKMYHMHYILFIFHILLIIIFFLLLINLNCPPRKNDTDIFIWRHWQRSSFWTWSETDCWKTCFKCIFYFYF